MGVLKISLCELQMRFFTAATALIATVLADGCNDTGGVDSYGDGCDWYAAYGYCTCGSWDDGDFWANMECCACGGGVGEGGQSCQDTTYGQTDTYGDGCDWYATYGYCTEGYWDHAYFVANDDCCACGGGLTYDVMVAWGWA